MFVSVLSASTLPVVSREPRSGDERRRANKDEVVSRLVVALQRLPAGEKKKKTQKETKAQTKTTTTQRLAAATVTEQREFGVRRPHQVGFGSAPAGVGLPETQASVSVHDAELHKTSRQTDIRPAVGQTMAKWLRAEPISFLKRPAELEEIKSSKYVGILSCSVFLDHFNKELNAVLLQRHILV